MSQPSIAGLQPAYSRTQAQRLSIRYVEDATTKKASWALDAGAPIPASLRCCSEFLERTCPAAAEAVPTVLHALLRAIRGIRHRPPTSLSDAIVAGSHRVTIPLHGSPQSATMGIVIPKSAKLRSIDIHGQHLVAPKDSDTDTLLGCASRDCAQEIVGLEFASRSDVSLAGSSSSVTVCLPFAARLVAARPAKAPFLRRSGDYMMLANSLTVKAK